MFFSLTKELVLDIIKLLSKGILAQLGEHLPYKQRVIGSSPIGPIFMQKHETRSLTQYGEVAQLARACGSYPQCRRFKSVLRYYSKSKQQ